MPAPGPWAFPSQDVTWLWVDGPARDAAVLAVAWERWRRHWEWMRRQEALEAEHQLQRLRYQQHWERLEGRRIGRRTTVQIHHRIIFQDLFFVIFCFDDFRARILKMRWICTVFLPRMARADEAGAAARAAAEGLRRANRRVRQRR